MTDELGNPRVGEKAPDFELKTGQGEKVSLAGLRGRPVLLIFYPGDDTPGCTKQLCAIRDDWQKFRDEGVEVFGVNHAGAGSHEQFRSKFGLPMHLLIDEGREVSRRYGALRRYFKNVIINRTVVLIGPDGVIRYLKRGMPSDEEILQHVAEVKSA